jgi:glycosyltransferase involved in cell wall biosynthesis
MLDRNCQKNVEFLNYVSEEELEKLYSRCTLFVAPSIYESFGIIFLEAMKYAKPVIGTRVGGIPEIIHENQTGFIIEPEDHHDLSQKIIHLLDNPSECKKLGRNGRKRIEYFFSDEKFADNTINIYKKVISNSRKQRNS